MGGLIGMLDYTSLVSSFKSHRTTNRDFRLGAQRAKLLFFFFRRKKSHCFSKARKRTKYGQFVVGGYAHMCR